MALVNLTESNSILLHPVSLAKMPFLAADKNIYYAGFDVFFGCDEKVWVLVSQIPESESASVINYFGDIADSIKKTLLSAITNKEIRWFCYFRGMSDETVYQEVRESIVVGDCIGVSKVQLTKQPLTLSP